MKVLVCGSRDWADPKPVISRLHALRMTALHRGEALAIIHGGARGADTIAGAWGSRQRFSVQPFPADWDRNGKRAGILRNLAMLDERPDLVLAFQRNGSRGTQHTIDEALRRGISVEVHTA